VHVVALLLEAARHINRLVRGYPAAYSQQNCLFISVSPFLFPRR
jgi:hypothetical protein